MLLRKIVGGGTQPWGEQASSTPCRSQARINEEGLQDTASNPLV